MPTERWTESDWEYFLMRGNIPSQTVSEAVLRMDETISHLMSKFERGDALTTTQIQCLNIRRRDLMFQVGSRST